MQYPLVSIIVITYNSADYVIETLDSILNQSYSNIELIITDDNSSDETLSLCSDWVKKHSECFTNTLILSSPVNTGTPANCNRGIQKSRGDWIKIIAGDDLLLNNCIKDLIDECLKFPEISILASKIYILKENKITKENIREENSFFSLSAKEQFFKLLQQNYIDAPSVIIKREIINKLEGFDERFRLIEDWPFWLKATANNYKIYSLDKFTSVYRVHSSSVTSRKIRLFDIEYYSLSMIKFMLRSEFSRIELIVISKLFWHNLKNKSLDVLQKKKIFKWLLQYPTIYLYNYSKNLIRYSK